MKLNLGLQKEKILRNVLGPYLVTPDELEQKVLKLLMGRNTINELLCE